MIKKWNGYPKNISNSSEKFRQVTLCFTLNILNSESRKQINFDENNLSKKMK